MEISFCSHQSCIEVITTKFCTWQDSCAVVACAKFCSDMIPYSGVTLKSFPLNLNYNKKKICEMITWVVGDVFHAVADTHIVFNHQQYHRNTETGTITMTFLVTTKQASTNSDQIAVLTITCKNGSKQVISLCCIPLQSLFSQNFLNDCCVEAIIVKEIVARFLIRSMAKPCRWLSARLQ